jgi:hypothetical protein
LVVCLLTFTSTASAAGDDATMFRVFLKDGTSLVSYGEFARVNDRVVFSMPTSAAPDRALQLVDLPADRVDWDRTNRYAASARAAHYIDTRAGADYIALSNEVAQSLNEVAETTDAQKRIAIVERARGLLADWPATHYNFKAPEIRQMLGMLDEAIADLRAKGTGRFDLSLAAYVDPTTIAEPLLPAATSKDAIDQTLLAAQLADQPGERTTLLSAALVSLDANAAALPSAWVSTTRTETNALIQTELRLDRQYKTLTTQMLDLAHQRAQAADVRGIDRLFARIYNRDSALGLQRPETVNALVAAVQRELDAARALRLARDKWALRAPELRAYGAAITPCLDVLALLKPALEGIKDLSGTSPGTLLAIRRLAQRGLTAASTIVPPDELKSAHAMLISAVDLADNAARIRREATLAENMTQAWDASSVASGALTLAAQARAEIRTALLPPKLR